MTDYLFAKPTFLAGVARILDLGCQFDSYNVSRNPAEADARAIIARAGVTLTRQVKR